MSCNEGAISIDGESSADLGLCIASKSVSAPTKNAVRVSVPGRSGSYDFSAAFGYVTFEDRELDVTFDLLEDSTEQLETSVAEAIAWCASAQESEIADDDLDGYHWLGTYIEGDYSCDESGLAAIVTAKFDVYPYKIADESTSQTLSVGTTTITNDGGRVAITVTPTGSSTTIVLGTVSQTFTGETTASFALEHGDNEFTVSSGKCTLTWTEEVL